MRTPLIQAPSFFADLIQLIVSMKRIDKFMNSDEVQKNIKDWKDEGPTMGRSDTCLSVHGSFSWGFTSNQKKLDKDNKKADEKGSDKKRYKDQVVVENMDESVDGESKDELKKLSKFVTLRDIKMDVKKGEFISIIGDVGSGKSSLLHSIIGDLIYLPQGEINDFGGLDHEGTQEEFD